MPRFLSADWFAALDPPAPIDPDIDVTVQQVVTGAPGGEVAYVVRARDGKVAVRVGRGDTPDVTITEDYHTAFLVYQGDLSPQTALMTGRVHVSGDVTRLLAHSDALAEATAALGDAGLREATTLE